MNVKGVKDMFKLASCRKSQAKLVNAWYWTFQSLLSNEVQVNVTTYGDCTLPLNKEVNPNEEDAWKELEKTVCVFVKPNKNTEIASLLDKLEELAENKESAPTSQAYDDYCLEIAALKKEILALTGN